MDEQRNKRGRKGLACVCSSGNVRLYVVPFSTLLWSNIALIIACLLGPAQQRSSVSMILFACCTSAFTLVGFSALSSASR